MTKSPEGMDANPTEVDVPVSPAIETDEQEIIGLHTAIEKVLDKIKWHEDKIDERKKDIVGHENQINDLRDSLRKHVGPLMNQTLNHHPKTDQRKEPKNREPSGATGALVLDCLKKSGQPLNTQSIKDFLESHGNSINPSVELSRLVKRGYVERSGRGLYKLKK